MHCPPKAHVKRDLQPSSIITLHLHSTYFNITNIFFFISNYRLFLLQFLNNHHSTLHDLDFFFKFAKYLAFWVVGACLLHTTSN